MKEVSNLYNDSYFLDCIVASGSKVRNGKEKAIIEIVSDSKNYFISQHPGNLMS